MVVEVSKEEEERGKDEMDEGRGEVELGKDGVDDGRDEWRVNKGKVGEGGKAFYYTHVKSVRNVQYLLGSPRWTPMFRYYLFLGQLNIFNNIKNDIFKNFKNNI